MFFFIRLLLVKPVIPELMIQVLMDQTEMLFDRFFVVKLGKGKVERKMQISDGGVKQLVDQPQN
jgi:hypothetical protein